MWIVRSLFLVSHLGATSPIVWRRSSSGMPIAEKAVMVSEIKLRCSRQDGDCSLFSETLMRLSLGGVCWLEEIEGNARRIS